MRFNWGWRIAIVYTTFALATLTFVGFALTKEVDLVRPDYYEHSLRHDATMSARARASVLQPNVTVDVDATDGRLRAAFPTSMVGASVTAVLYRASALHDDRTVVSTVMADGTWSASIGKLQPAPWTVTLQWTHAGAAYEVQRRITVE